MGLGAVLLVPGALWAQAVPAGPVIDTIIIETGEPFDAEAAASSGVFRGMNAIHIPTRPWVIRRELLFEAGEPFDPLMVEETERNLRSLGIFSDVAVDTTRIDGKLAAVVRTQDGWSPTPKISFSAATDGTVTTTLGASDANFLGTGNYLYAAYRKDVDRSGLDLRGEFNRFFGTPVRVSGDLLNFSDGREGSWMIGSPFRSNVGRVAVDLDGEVARQRVLQFRTDEGGPLDTTQYQRRAFINRLNTTVAPVADPARYLRLGLMLQLRREEFVLFADTGSVVPDTLTFAFGLTAEARRARYTKVQYYNGFTEEDVDLSRSILIGLHVAPSGFGGYERFGVGPRVRLAAGRAHKRGFLYGSIEGNAIFDGAGLDSGRVVIELTTVTQSLPRQSTVFHVEGGIMEAPPPGEEFDLGFDTPPRSYAPHAFVGTRSIWASFEQRWYVWDNVLNLLGVGFAAFADYGGAWYADQDPRWGGAVGAGLRLGSPLATVAQTARIDLGYLLGEFRPEKKLVLTFGGGFDF
jgi:outer membrane protein assembly factor BamA